MRLSAERDAVDRNAFDTVSQAVPVCMGAPKTHSVRILQGGESPVQGIVGFNRRSHSQAHLDFHIPDKKVRNALFR